TAVALGLLGYLAHQHGDAERAAARAAESLESLRAGGFRWYLPEALELAAAVAGARSQPERAARLFGAAAALRETTGAELPPVELAAYERHRATARTASGEAAFSAAWDAGRAMNPEQAIDSALVDEPAAPSFASAPPR